MDDARRFLRYVLPGTLFAVEVLLWFSFLHPLRMANFLDQLKQESGVAVALALLVASGGLGYLFSIIHHWLHWRRSEGTLDHQQVIRALIDSGLLYVFRA